MTEKVRNEHRVSTIKEAHRKLVKNIAKAMLEAKVNDPDSLPAAEQQTKAMLRSLRRNYGDEIIKMALRNAMAEILESRKNTKSSEMRRIKESGSYMANLSTIEAKLKKAVLDACKNGDASFEATAEFEVSPGLGIVATAYMLDVEDDYISFVGYPVSYEDDSLTEFWSEDRCNSSNLKDLVIGIFEQFDLTKIYGNAKTLVQKSFEVKNLVGLSESTKKAKRFSEDQITRKQKEKLNLLNDIVNFAYEYGENETKSLFKQAFKRVTGDDLADSLTDTE